MGRNSGRWLWHETPCTALRWKYRFICQYGKAADYFTLNLPYFRGGQAVTHPQKVTKDYINGCKAISGCEAETSVKAKNEPVLKRCQKCSYEVGVLLVGSSLTDFRNLSGHSSFKPYHHASWHTMVWYSRALGINRVSSQFYFIYLFQSTMCCSYKNSESMIGSGPKVIIVITRLSRKFEMLMCKFTSSIGGMNQKMTRIIVEKISGVNSQDYVHTTNKHDVANPLTCVCLNNS